MVASLDGLRSNRRRARIAVQHKDLDDTVKLDRLGLGPLDGGVGLLDQGCVMLGHLVELAHGIRHLLNRGRLFAARRSNGLDQAAALACRLPHRGKFRGRLLHQPAAARHFTAAGLDQRLDLR